MNNHGSEFAEFILLHSFLRTKADEQGSSCYLVPDMLIGGSSPQKLVDVRNPYRFYLHIFDTILARAEQYAAKNTHDGAVKQAGFSTNDHVYQSYIRTFAALNGEIGTALKQVAFLPHLRERLGITVFISLPAGVIGRTNRKGQRGSPFAISNPFDIDPSLADPLLPEFSPLFQYKALVQACRLLSIRTGSIVPLATLSIDSPLFRIIPALGFWWEAAPGELLFCAVSAHTSAPLTYAGDVYVPPRIADEAKHRFAPPPTPEAVTVRAYGEQSYYVAAIEHQGVRRSVTLANAFPDVLAGDTHIYTWSDVAPVNYTNRLYPSAAGVYDPTAYDPSQLAWSLMPCLIAWRNRELGEEVFLVDVSPSVPVDILARARRLAHAWSDEISVQMRRLGTANADLQAAAPLLDWLACALNTPPAHTEEAGERTIDFIGEELWSFDSLNNMAGAVVGPLIFAVSAHTHNHEVFVTSLRYHLMQLETRKGTNLFLAGVANHDTMPPLPDVSPLLYLCYYFLPRAIPLIFSGSEFYAQTITNKEFGFDTSPELLSLRRQLADDVLGLFNDRPLDWGALPTTDRHGRAVADLCDLLHALGLLKRSLAAFDLSSYRFLQLQSDGQATNCFGYLRSSPCAAGDALIVLANWDWVHPYAAAWPYVHAAPILTVHAGELPKVLAPGDLVTLPPCSAMICVTGTLLYGTILE